MCCVSVQQKYFRASFMGKLEEQLGDRYADFELLLLNSIEKTSYVYTNWEQNFKSLLSLVKE